MKNGTNKGQKLMKKKRVTILKINRYLILLASETLLRLQQRNLFIKHKPIRRIHNKIEKLESR